MDINTNVPPYHFMINLALETIKTKSQNDQDNNRIKFFKDLLSIATTKYIDKNLRIVEIDKSLFSLILYTNNTFFYRPLFFQSIFIDKDIDISDNYILKGILCLDTNVKEMDFKKNWYIISFALNKNTNEEMMLTIELITSPDLVCEYNTIYGKENQLNPSEIDIIKNEIKNILCNIVDLVDHNKTDIIQTIIKTSAEDNEKKIKRGKLPLPTKIFIRPSESLKQYVKEFNDKGDTIGKNSLKPLVTGYYKQSTKEKLQWIKPYWNLEEIISK